MFGIGRLAADTDPVDEQMALLEAMSLQRQNRQRQREGTMSTKNEAIREALANCERWLHGAVVVVDGDDYEAWPSAHMTDISYTGAREVVVEIDNLADVTGDERAWDELDASEQDATVEMVAND